MSGDEAARWIRGEADVAVELVAHVVENLDGWVAGDPEAAEHALAAVTAAMVTLHGIDVELRRQAPAAAAPDPFGGVRMPLGPGNSGPGGPLPSDPAIASGRDAIEHPAGEPPPAGP